MIGTWQIFLILIILILLVLQTIMALIDIIKSEFNGKNKIIWLCIVLFTNFFGAVLYFLIGVEQKINK